jgi:hypothetical protein
MSAKAWAVSTLICISLSANGQDANLYSGTWKAEIAVARGAPREGKVTLAEGSGTCDFSTYTSNRNDLCAGRVSPITVTVATPTELAFDVTRSKALTGCSDFVVKLKRVDDKTMEGDLVGNKLMLVRQ